METVNEKIPLHNDARNILIEKSNQSTASDGSRNSRTHRGSNDVDGGWAWVVCAASFAVNVLFNGQIASSTVFFVSFQQAFQQSRSSISWIFGAQGAAVCIAGPLASFCIRKWGPRYVIICGSLLMALSMTVCYFANSIIYLAVFFGICGVGGSFLFTSAVAALTMFFKDRLYVATGIAIAGAGMGIIVLAPLLEWTTKTYGWRGAILLQGAVLLQGVVCGALIFTPKTPKIESQLLQIKNSKLGTETNNGPKPSPTRALLRDLRTWLIIFCIVLHFINFSSFLLCLKDFLVQEKAIGISFSVVAVVAGLANAVARVISGLLAKFALPSVLFTVASFMAAASIAPLVLITHDWLIVVSVGVINFGFGLQAVLMNLMTANMFGGRDMAAIFSYGLFGSVFGVLPAPLLLGYMKDITGSYRIPFAAMAMLLSLAGLCSLTAFYVHKKMSTNKLENRIKITIN